MTYPEEPLPHWEEDPESERLRQLQDSQIVDCLGKVGLGFLEPEYGLDEVLSDWSDRLSGGEQQRLALARLLFQRPVFAFLDESTSALDVYHQDLCMRAIVAAEITMISVAHRATVLPYHDHVLSLTMTGDWSLAPISQEQFRYAEKQQKLAEAMLENKFDLASDDDPALGPLEDESDALLAVRP